MARLFAPVLIIGITELIVGCSGTEARNNSVSSGGATVGSGGTSSGNGGVSNTGGQGADAAGGTSSTIGGATGASPTGGAATGGNTTTGGAASGGAAPATGGTNTATGGASAGAGGKSSAGKTGAGGAATGGVAPIGGSKAATGGRATGGTTGVLATGGAPTGGVATGGASIGGKSAGGTGAGGKATGGTNVGGASAGGAKTAGSGTGDACTGSALPAVTDYGANGPFATSVVNDAGPSNGHTIFRPTSLGQDGFKHPLITWGNGINSTPSGYTEYLSTYASHGFVVIASNSSNVTDTLMKQGLDWLIAQNSTAGDYQGKLAPNCAAAVGYSWGGMGAVNAGNHPNVIVTVSHHGLKGTSEKLHGPLLLFTSTGDTFVTAAEHVTPTFNSSTVQTFYATLTGGSHLTPTGDADGERAPAVAWLRLWVYGDQGARKYFYGDTCVLCADPWTNPQRKNWQ